MEYTALLAILSPFLLFFKQFQGIVLKIFRLFWKNRIIPSDYRLQFYKELSQLSYRFSLDDYNLFTHWVFSRKDEKFYSLACRTFAFEIHFYKCIVPVFVFAQTDDSLKVQYLKYTFPFEKLLEICALKNIELLKNSRETCRYFQIVERRGTSLKQQLTTSFNTGPTSSTQPTNNPPKTRLLYLSEILDLKRQDFFGLPVQDLCYNMPEKERSYVFTESGMAVKKQVEKWLSARDWYDKRHIVWKRSILLNGKPGNGKSSLILEIAKSLELIVYVFDLSTMDNSEFVDYLNGCCSGPALLLFEDIDNIFDQRQNITKTEKYGGLTFDCFINRLDGVNGFRNKFVFLTTNHLEKLDPALIRPGRVDEIIHIQPLTTAEKEKLATKILTPNIDLIPQIVKEGENDTTAEFQNRCIRKALDIYWNKI